MRIFVTGATGFIGTAVVRELLEAGHQVVGLARTEQAAAALTAVGAEAFRGSLDEPDRLGEGAARADGVIHLAFVHDFSNFAAACQTDKTAIEAIGEALAGTGKPFIITSGTLVGASLLPPGQLLTEQDATQPADGAVPRFASELAAMALVERGVRAAIVRLSPSVHGEGDRGFVPELIRIARRTGVAAYIGDGTNRWPAVHRLDAARLFRLAVEAAPAGARLNGVADEGVLLRDIAGVIGRGLGLPVVSLPKEEATGHFGWLGGIAASDNPSSSAGTQKLLGWKPEQPSLLADLEEGHYFNG